jgi:hypothetical protein
MARDGAAPNPPDARDSSALPVAAGGRATAFGAACARPRLRRFTTLTPAPAAILALLGYAIV